MSTDFNETPGAARYRKSSGSTGLKGILSNPIFKLAAVVVVVGGGAIAGVQYMNRRQVVEETVIPVAATEGAISDPTEATPEYLRAVQELDQNRANEAAARGESALPTPLSTAVSSPTVLGTDLAVEESDPLRDFESLINPPAPTSSSLGSTSLPGQAELPTGELTVPQTQILTPEIVEKYTRLYRSQMDLLMTQWTPPSLTTVSGIDDLSLTQASAGAQATAAQAGGSAASSARVLVPAGTVYYGEMVTEANSDFPGPILARVLTGPFAGARLVGTFEVFRESLALRFRTIVFRKKEYTADILALDPDTTLGSVATEVDSRYFSRVLMPAAARFLSSFGEAISEPTSTTSVTSSGSSSITTNSTGDQDLKDALYAGMGDAFDRVAQFTDEEAAAIKRLVRVAVGTPIGLFFVAKVTDSEQ